MIKINHVFNITTAEYDIALCGLHDNRAVAILMYLLEHRHIDIE